MHRRGELCSACKMSGATVDMALECQVNALLITIVQTALDGDRWMVTGSEQSCGGS